MSSVQPDPSRPLERLVPIACIAFCAIVAALVWSTHFDVTLNWKRSYDALHRFGEDCEAAVGLWGASDDFASVRARRHDFQPAAMPYRGSTTLLPVKSDSYLIVRCRADLSKLKPDGYAWMSLGNVFGSSAVYLGDRLKMTLADDREAAFPLAPEERTAGAVVTVISRARRDNDRPGTASLLPLAFGDARPAFERVSAMLKSWSVEMPIFRVGFALAIVLTLGVAWICGLRYRDVGWMIAILTFIVAESWVNYTPHSDFGEWRSRASYICRFGVALSFGAFFATFLRLRLPPGWVETIFLSALGVIAALCVTVPFEMAQTLGLGGMVPFYGTAVAFSVGAYAALRKAREVPLRRRRRLQLIAATAVIGAVAYVVQSYSVRATGVLLYPFLNFAFATIFAVYLAVDLTAFRRSYLEEKAHRQKEERQKQQLQQRLTLGKAVQDLLVPEAAAGAIGALSYAFHYEPYEEMSGDWLLVWPGDTERRLLIGDVVGKGPQAALAVASIAAIARRACADGLTLEATVESVNRTLFDLFKGYMTSTCVAASVAPDGKVSLVNCGGLGWLKVAGGKLSSVSGRGPLLGVDPKVRVAREDVTLAPGEVLVAATDGVLDGTRTVRHFARAVEGAHEPAEDLKAVFRMALAAGRESAHDDDRTILAIGRPHALGARSAS